MKKKIKIKIYSDGASLRSFKKLSKNKMVKGFTTNPSLLLKEGVKDYKKFSKSVFKIVKNKPVSFEVFSDDLKKMEKEALIIGKWSKNVYVKIPITNSKGKSTHKIIQKLNDSNIKVNITAIFTTDQVKYLLNKVNFKSNCILSIFAGRIADTGSDPKKTVKDIINISKKNKRIEILWASVREIFNIFEAQNCGCHIITVPPNILDKLNSLGKNLNLYSLETVKQFANDAQKAKLRLT